MGAMKDSGIEWIGEIPAEWDLLKLKYCSYLKGRIGWQGLRAEEFTEEGPYLITGTDFENGRIQFERSYHITEERYAEAPQIQLKVGDLLITKDGTVGKMALVTELPDKASLNSHLLLIRPLQETFDNGYLFWLMSSPVFVEYTNFAQSGTIMASLSQEKIGNFVMYFPTIKEQQAIAKLLENQCAKIDDVIADITKQIELLQQYKKSLITETVTKGLDKSVPMKDSGVEWIGEIPAEWTTKRIKYVLEGMKDGTHATYDRVDEGRMLLSAKNVFEDGLHIGYNESMISENDYKTIVSNGYPKKGDVLLCCVGTIGRTCVYGYDEAMAFQRSVIFMRPSKEILSDYLCYALRTEATECQETLLVNKTAQDGLYMGAAREIIITIPSTIDEQNAIVSFLDEKCTQIDSILESKQKQLETITEHKKSLIYEYVTGKKRVKEVQ